MRRLGRPLALCLSLVLAFSLLPAVSGAAPVALTDLAGHWARADVQFLVERGVVGGFPDGSYRPDQPVSRGEYLALLARMVGTQPRAEGALPLAVTPAGHWALPVLRALAAAGVVRAGDGNPLDLDAPVARREMVRWLVRARGWDTGRPISSYLSDLPGDAEAAVLNTGVARGLFTGYPDRSFRPDNGATRAEAAAVIARLADPGRRPVTWREQYAVGGVALSVVRVNLQRPGLRPRVVLGQDHIGGTESLAAMAARSGAVAAINGTYFEAYADSVPREPWGTIVRGGELVHVGAQRAAIGFFGGGRATVDIIGPKVAGKGWGGTWETNWYAYGLNHHGRAGYGDNWVTVYTPAHGTEMGISQGTSITVRTGTVTDIGAGAVPIPADGFVVSLGGSEQSLASRFAVGRPASYQADLGARWQGVQELLQVGPRLVAAGAVAVNLDAEGFTEDKITTLAMARSAVALTDDGVALLLTSPGARVHDLAAALAQLGVQDALCFDSGASSGLWYKGDLITQPGRELSNSLVFTQE